MENISNNHLSLKTDILNLKQNIENTNPIKNFPEFENCIRLLLNSLDYITKFEIGEDWFEWAVRQFYDNYLNTWYEATKFDLENKNFEGQNPMLGSKFQDYFLKAHFALLIWLLLHLAGWEEKFSYLKENYNQKLKDLKK